MSVAADGLPPLREVIRDYGLNAKKSLGQNFILDLNLTRRIARCCGPLDGRTVVEVGPGPGGLTRALLAEGAAHVVAIERDDRCLAALADVASHWPGRLHLSHGDALEADFARLVAPYRGAGDPKPLIIANLPYGIATKLLVGWLTLAQWPPWYGGMALMFQKEVAERIVAPPGGKAYGRLAVLAQWRAEASIALTLPPQAFVPPPKVSSAVVVLTPRQHAEPECRVQTLARLTAAAFGRRRKMLRASLKQLLPDPDTLLAEAGIDPAWRGEQIDVAGFARLAALIDARGGHGVGLV